MSFDTSEFNDDDSDSSNEELLLLLLLFFLCFNNMFFAIPVFGLIGVVFVPSSIIVFINQIFNLYNFFIN